MNLTIFLAGLVSVLSPCVLPLLPIVASSVLTARKRDLLLLILGFILAFCASGVVIGVISEQVFVDPQWIRLGGAALMITMGVQMLLPQLSSKLGSPLDRSVSAVGRYSERVVPKRWQGSFFQGASLGLIWAPCIGPALGAALGFLAISGTQFKGALHLSLFALGASVPLLILAMASKQLGAIWLRSHRHKFQIAYRVSAVVLIVVGLLVLTKLDKRLEAVAVEHLPGWWNEILIKY